MTAEPTTSVLTGAGFFWRRGENAESQPTQPPSLSCRASHSGYLPKETTVGNMILIPTFDANMAIHVRVTNRPELSGTTCLLRDFAHGRKLDVFRTANKEILCRRADDAFVLGKELSS